MRPLAPLGLLTPALALALGACTQTKGTPLELSLFGAGERWSPATLAMARPKPVADYPASGTTKVAHYWLPRPGAAFWVGRFEVPTPVAEATSAKRYRLQAEVRVPQAEASATEPWPVALGPQDDLGASQAWGGALPPLGPPVGVTAEVSMTAEGWERMQLQTAKGDALSLEANADWGQVRWQTAQDARGVVELQDWGPGFRVPERSLPDEAAMVEHLWAKREAQARSPELLAFLSARLGRFPLEGPPLVKPERRQAGILRWQGVALGLYRKRSGDRP